MAYPCVVDVMASGSRGVSEEQSLGLARGSIKASAGPRSDHEANQYSL